MLKNYLIICSFTLRLTKRRALVAEIMKVAIFWDATPSSLVDL
jgi:hypothetical protein